VLPYRAGWAAFVIAIVAGGAGARGQSVSVSPTTLAFGNQALGTTSVVRAVTLKNGQTTAITISSISTSLSEYVQTNNCPATLRSATKCVVTVTFTASMLGPETAYVTITDSTAGSPHNMYLLGVGK